MSNLSSQYQKQRVVLSVFFAGLLTLATLFAGPSLASADAGFSGKVTDLSGAPFSGITVQAVDVNSGAAVAPPVLTGADGTYAYSGLGLPAGTYAVEFQNLNVGSTAPAVFYNNKLSLKDSDALTLSDGVVTPNINAIIGGWGEIGGKVTNAGNAGISGIQVSVCDLNGQPISGLATATSKSDGSYMIGGITPAGTPQIGAYKVRFNGNSQYGGFWYSSSALASGAVPVSVVAYQTTSVSQVLPSANISGTVTDTAGAPIPNIQVYLYDAALNFYPVGGVLTSADGTYAITGIAPGTYGVLFQDVSSPVVYQKQYYNLQSSRPAPSLTISGGAPLTGINATLKSVPGAPTAVSASAGNGNAQVSFSAPAFNGGSAITSYTVTSAPDGITQSGSASPITVNGLTNGTAYSFTVTAHNAIGTGAASTASNSVTPAAPQVNGACGSSNGTTFPVAPTANLCSAGTASVVAGSGPWTWSCNGSDGGSTANCSATFGTGTVLKAGWSMPGWTTNSGYYNTTAPLATTYASAATMATTGASTVSDVFTAFGLPAGYVVVGPGGSVFLAGSPFNTLKNILPGMAYWVYVPSDTVVNLPGTALNLTQQIPLPTAGWAQVGYWGTDAVTPALGFACMSGAFDTVVDEAGKVYIPGSPFNTLKALTQNKGYFIHTTAPTTLRYQCP